VTLTRPTKELDNLLPATPVLEAVPATAVRPTVVRSPAPAPENPDVRALRVDMQLLLWKVDRLHQQATSGDQMLQAAKELGAVAGALPQQVHEAISHALELQRQETRAMFGDLRQRILDDIGQVRETLRPPADASSPAASVADLDNRFVWLVEAVSDRFVTLGNGLARVERHLAVEPAARGTADGTGDGTGDGTADGTGDGDGDRDLQDAAPAGDQGGA